MKLPDWANFTDRWNLVIWGLTFGNYLAGIIVVHLNHLRTFTFVITSWPVDLIFGLVLSNGRSSKKWRTRPFFIFRFLRDTIRRTSLPSLMTLLMGSPVIGYSLWVPSQIGHGLNPSHPSVPYESQGLVEWKWSDKPEGALTGIREFSLMDFALWTYFDALAHSGLTMRKQDQ